MAKNYSEKGQVGALQQESMTPSPITSTGPSTGTTTPSIHSDKGGNEKQIEAVTERAVLPEQLGSELSRQVRRK